MTASQHLGSVDVLLCRRSLRGKRLFVGMAGLVLAFSAWGEDAYIQSDGTQYIATGYCASPDTKIVCDFAYTDATTQQ